MKFFRRLFTTRAALLAENERLRARAMVAEQNYDSLRHAVELSFEQKRQQRDLANVQESVTRAYRNILEWMVFDPAKKDGEL